VTRDREGEQEREARLERKLESELRGGWEELYDSLGGYVNAFNTMYALGV
jgi:hypothetical protein